MIKITKGFNQSCSDVEEIKEEVMSNLRKLDRVDFMTSSQSSGFRCQECTEVKGHYVDK